MRQPKEFDLFGFVAFMVSAPVVVLLPFVQLLVILLGIYSLVAGLYEAPQPKPRSAYEENLRNYEEFLQKVEHYKKWGW